MQLALDLSLSDDRSLQAQIFDRIEALILSGKLHAGFAVPSSRALSENLGVSRNTVIIAYEKLHSEGYLETRRGVGTFVCSDLPTISPDLLKPAAARPGIAAPAGPSVLRGPARVQQVSAPAAGPFDADFWIGRSDRESFPLTEWRRMVGARLLTTGGGVSDYPDPRGLPELREAIADHIGPARGIPARPDEVLVTGGAQDGLALVALAAREGGRCFVHEDPCYQGARYLFEAMGYTCHAVPVDREGLMTADLPESRNNLLYVTPSHQFPLGVQLSLNRRLELLDWAERTDSHIIEDDYNGDFRYEGAPLTALRGLDRRGRVIYLGTFSKAFGPGLRLGYIVMPPGMARALVAWKALISNGTTWLEQAAVADFIASGGYQRHLRRLRSTCLRRRDRTIAALEAGFGHGIELRGRRGGAHLSMVLPDRDIDVAELSRRARAARVGVYGVETCGAHLEAPQPCARRSLFFGYAAVPEARIAPALQKVATIASELEAGR